MLLPATPTKTTSRTSFIFVESLEPSLCLCKHIYFFKQDVKHSLFILILFLKQRVNAVSNGQLTGEAYTTGCLGSNGVRIWFFFGFLLGFGSLIGASWILFGEYVTESKIIYQTQFFLLDLTFHDFVVTFSRREDLQSQIHLSRCRYIPPECLHFLCFAYLQIWSI